MAKNTFKLEDHTGEVKKELRKAAIAWLYEAGSELQAQTMRNTAVDTGQLKGSWRLEVDTQELEAIVGSPLENAIWEEFGTGEHALEGKGRQTPWVYQDAKGNWHYTKGKKPRRALHNAFTRLKPKLIKLAQEKFKGMD